MTGPASSQFVKNYGFFVSPGTYNNQPVVVCTTCHNQHLMNVVKVSGTITASNGHGLRPAGGQLRDDVLHSRSLQPGQHDRRQQPDGAVLPPVPWWRVERNERRHGYNNFLNSLCMRGGAALSLPFFLDGGQLDMKFPLSVLLAFLLPAFAAAGAQVTSHTPTDFSKSPAQGSTGGSVEPGGDSGCARERLDFDERRPGSRGVRNFPLRRQHNGIPKEFEKQIHDGALKMIIFEELVYQEALRRKMTVAPAKMQLPKLISANNLPRRRSSTLFCKSDFTDRGSCSMTRSGARY